MLKSLLLSNIILIEKAEIYFERGLNVLSGETGSGKSAIMSALNYIAGARADLSLLRHGSEKGVIQATFDVDAIPQIKQLLEDSGIDHSPGEELIILRELLTTGKSRAFINHHPVQLGLLKKIGEHLLEIVGQHANQRLMELPQHREILDLFGATVDLRNQFRTSWEKETRLKKQLSELINNESQRLREVEICRMELEELEAARLKEDEEEELFAEYTRLTSSEELSKYATEAWEQISGEQDPLLPRLKQVVDLIRNLAQLDPELKGTEQSAASLLLELEEMGYTVRDYLSGIEFQPERIAEINDRLAVITKMKKKYGPTVKDVRQYLLRTQEKFEELENADVQTEALQKEICEIEKLNHSLAQDLTEQRLKAAKKLEKAMKGQMGALNMPKAEFFVRISKQDRSWCGDDAIEFHFSPNPGEKVLSVRECASGGELSRLMLALQTLLAGKENIPTLIFDEIDANIGGETAAIVGEKLKEIGGGHQVLCVTHFPQVASCAHHHLQIAKHESKGRTYTTVKALSKNEREDELARMHGKKAS